MKLLQEGKDIIWSTFVDELNCNSKVSAYVDEFGCSSQVSAYVDELDCSSSDDGYVPNVNLIVYVLNGAVVSFS